jgi:DNA processing protein
VNGPQVLSDKERCDWVRLARTPGIGPVTFAELLRRHRTPAAALDALPGLARKAGKATPPAIPSAARIEDEINRTQRHGARLLASCEAAFPALLRTLEPPPPILSVLGDVSLAQRPCVAMVGARNASAVGRKIARDMAAGLGAAGWVVVSGLARGIDAEAHAASLSSGTIAVLGGGVDHIYPPENEGLYRDIAQRGLIVSESPLGHRAQARDFPRRNRIISGMARGVVVVEAAEGSGSLITARMAGEQNREVMAVPGSPLDPRAVGAIRLLQQGAHVVIDARDVIAVLDALPRLALRAPSGGEYDADPEAGDTPPGQVAAVREALSPAPLSVEEIARAAGISVRRCMIILMELEIAGVAITHPGGLASLNVDGPDA